MAKQYKALQPVGRFKVGDTVGNLTRDQIKSLIAERVIEEIKQPQPKLKEAKLDG